ncbi:MAG: PASTA domain-containing protein [Candidatus Babeliales bacterium]|jgi:beta-lactam-binding protein with PASTA domain
METVKPKILHKVDAKKRIPAIVWLMPFASFIIGYFVIGYFFRKTDQQTPSVIGKSLYEAAQILSQNQLSMRLLQEREDASLAEGTIIDQLPRPTQKIRPNQSVFVTVAVRAQRQYMPQVWGKKHKEVIKILEQQGFEVNEAFLSTDYPSGTCIAQLPAGGEPLKNNKVTVYFSEGPSRLCVMPSLKGAALADVEVALRECNVRAEITHQNPIADNHTCEKCKIIDQEPVPGAVVNIAQGLNIQLKVSE